MKVYVAGATGAIGRQLVPMLIEHGHGVVAMTRSPEKADPLKAVGAEPVVADVLDRAAVMGAIGQAKPDAVVHQATALSGRFDMKHFDRFFAQTDRIRTLGTDILLDAAREAGVRRFVAQSYAGWPSVGDRAVEPELPEAMRPTMEAIRYLEATVLGAEDLTGVVLRYGPFYGPGTGLAEGGDIVEAVRRRWMPIVGDGAGVWSFIHVEDAAAATIAALEHGTRGVYDIVDDEPTTTAEFLPELARVLGAKPPLHVPVWLAKPLIGEAGVYLMTKVRPVSNERAKVELGWTPRYPSWRIGFREGLEEVTARSA
jgi:2-alkyl-3-oxoalkanoate reductase